MIGIDIQCLRCKSTLELEIRRNKVMIICRTCEDSKVLGEIQHNLDDWTIRVLQRGDCISEPFPKKLCVVLLNNLTKHVEFENFILDVEVQIHEVMDLKYNRTIEDYLKSYSKTHESVLSDIGFTPKQIEKIKKIEKEVD